MRRIEAALALTLLLAAPARAQHQHGAAPPAAPAAPLAPPGRPPVLRDIGNASFPVTTKSKEVRRWFNQGLSLCYAFNHDEAVRAFEEAARLDPGCAMAHWGIAYACGPNINLPMDAEHGKRAYEEIQRALTLAPKAGARERAYIQALSKRYGAPPVGDQRLLDIAYADAMRDLMQQRPADADAATLFAEALMLLRPWDYWTPEGNPQPGTEELVSVLERTLKKNPKHAGAIHFYIHAMEASPHPERAAPYADRLPTIAPNAGHLVHMPTHLYIRLGRYAEVSGLNGRAIEVDRRYLGKERIESASDVYRLMYYTHNIHMRWAGLLFEGRSADALAAARDVVAATPVDAVRQMPPMEFWPPVYLYTLARFARWDEILAEPAPPPDLRFTSGIRHYARGLAFVAKGNHGEAAVALDSLATIEAATPEDAVLDVGCSTKQVLHVGTAVLRGKLALAQNHPDFAIEQLQDAVRTQDRLRYTEPPIWYYPVRQSLGVALIRVGRPADAERAFREDLERYPANGWSLYGLVLSLRARGNLAAAAEVEKEFRKAWAWSDMMLDMNLL
jgi:tetratricopeptide (TPR) repeat protein